MASKHRLEWTVYEIRRRSNAVGTSEDCRHAPIDRMNMSPTRVNRDEVPTARLVSSKVVQGVLEGVDHASTRPVALAAAPWTKTFFGI